MATILIVEDNNDINHLIKTFLQQEGHICFQAFSGTEAKFYLPKSPDLIILDLMLPGQTGEDLILEIRKQSAVPILVVSAKITLHDRLSSLKLGADDFLMKPFDPEELLIRVFALLRRSNLSTTQPFNPKNSTPTLLQVENIKLNTQSKEAFYLDDPLNLTPTELLLLEQFLRSPSKVFSREELYKLIWSEDCFVDDNSITVHISHLRNKLKQKSNHDFIQTVWGIGYKLKLRPKS